MSGELLPDDLDAVEDDALDGAMLTVVLAVVDGARADIDGRLTDGDYLEAVAAVVDIWRGRRGGSPVE